MNNKTIIAIICSCLFSFEVFAQQHSNTPNIVFIVADDLGYGDLSCYGQQKFKTPNIDLLAKQGMRFTQFYAGTSVCAPSRASLLTGKHTGHTYIRGNKELEPEGQEPLPEHTITLPEVLKRAGYVTGIFGKWGLGPVGSSGDPLKQGVDKFFGYNCQRQSHRYFPTHLWDNDEKVVLEENGQLDTMAVYAPDLIQVSALNFLEANKNRPFFLMLTYTLPHAELQLPEDDDDFQQFKSMFGEQPYKGDDYGPGALVAGYASQRYPRAAFAAMVTRLDNYVGEVMAELKKQGLEKNTIVIFTSDNGPHTEGGADPGFFNSAGGLRGVKRDLYEGGIRVPFIARWPGKIRANTTNLYTGAFYDLVPTLAQVSRSPMLVASDGVSLVPALTGAGKQKEHPYLYWEFHENGGRQAVRQGKWKAVRLQAKGNPDGAVELYDLVADPKETKDLAAAYPAIAARMAAYMKAAHEESPAFPFFTTK
ncbi:arylsulfatase A-like enzyme [Chitinophaga terrae (ex Kim and Jung 2007)]|uniref:arylsulfatase n=1 Tax=Chitinophaga terrae (ex Kim and Jung 2007) TaxID=408074 RepID=UPI00278A0070|nr:arylsulfatase [Chitinophaga terrae (ex Kim and Jung 2007)]MDQ0108941.1 arylsulfatase A-like enzyme [Chitinophaga terrae (ex Kim and Jung 2007)]